MVAVSKERREAKFRILEGLSADEASEFLKRCTEKKYADWTCLFVHGEAKGDDPLLGFEGRR